MTVDLTKLNLFSPDNAFKNVSRYTGSITFPTSVGAGSTATVSTSFTLTGPPVFTEFFANILELNEAVTLYGTAAGTTPKRWYSSNVPGNFGIAIHETSPSTLWLNCGMSPTISGNTVTVTGYMFNGGGSTITLDSLTVPFVFIEYTLAA